MLPCVSSVFISHTLHLFFLRIPPPPRSTLFPYTTLFRSQHVEPDSNPANPAGTAEAYSTTATASRSEEHTSELQSLRQLVCRLLLEKKNVAVVEYGSADTTGFARFAARYSTTETATKSTR